MQGSSGYVVNREVEKPKRVKHKDERVIKSGSHAIHVFPDGENDWCVWLNTEIQPDGCDGICLGSAETREAALAQASEVLAAALVSVDRIESGDE